MTLELPDFRQLDKRIDDRLNQILQRSLVRDLDTRYPTADELLYDAIAFDKVVFNHVFGGADKTEKADVINFLLGEYWAP